MKRLAVICLCAVALSGCLHSEERVTINADGSGSVEAHLKIHPGTIQLIDAMFGGMIQAFQSMAQGPDKTAAPAQVSVAERMFANRQDLEQRIQSSGVPATLESFNSEKKDDGLHVNYSIKTADISALAKTPVLMFRQKIMRNVAGDWFCRPIVDRKERDKGQQEKARLENFKNSSTFQSMPPAMQSMFSSAMMDFRIESQLAFPAALTDVAGVFQKKDDRTVSVAIGPEMFTDPQVQVKWMEANAKTIARTGGGPVPSDFFAVLPEEGDPQAQAVPALSASSAAPRVVSGAGSASLVKVFLKNGKVAEGTLLERTDSYIKIDFQGVALTYYQDEINRVE